jgi:hypothetical protein
MKRLVIVLGLTSGCTLFGFDELNLVECRDNERCRPLNEAHGLDITRAAEVYQCASDHQGCVLSPTDWDDDGALAQGPDGERDCDDANPEVLPGNAESCDKLDNDCDGVIDETVYGNARPSARSDLGSASWLDFGSLTSQSDSGSLDVTVIAPQHGAVTLRVLSSQDDAPLERLVIATEGAVSAEKCPVITAEHNDEIEAQACSADALATDGKDGALRLGAAVDFSHCTDGLLRFGRVVDNHFVVPSTVGCFGGAYPFVSADAGEVKCTARDDVYGVLRVELAQLPSRGPTAPTQALATWIGTHPLGHDACGRMNGTPVASDPVDSLSRTSVGVAAMAFWPDEAGTLSTTSTEGLAQPELLGVTRGGSAPAIEPVVLPDGSEHYIVAFGTDAGPSLRAVARVDTPEACGEGEAPALSMRSADPWSDAESTHFAADQLVIAKGPVLDDACGTHRAGARLGVAWMERCGAAGAELWFATADFSPSTGFCNPSVPQHAATFDQGGLLGQAGARLEPVLAHVAKGVLRDAGLGAFVLVWIEGDGKVRARRASAELGTFVDQAIDLGETGARALGARRLLGGDLELEVVRANGVDALEVAQRRLSGGCGG